MLPLRSALVVLSLTSALLFGCSKQQAEPAAPPEPTDAPAEPAAGAPPTAERPQLTAEECTAQGGTVVGDIGDGAIHRPDYKCPSGAAPSGSIQSDPKGPVAIEGSVCCPG